MSNRPLILVTNDDGINSPGLHAVAEAVADLGELLIMAPSSQQTGAGRSYPITADDTIQTTEIPLKGGRHPAYTAQVSPAQAVILAIRKLAPRPIDLCISGINYGENVGSGITISGTVGAAIEAACSNIPALAMSLETPKEFHLNLSDEVDFRVAAHFTRYFAQQTLAKRLPPKVDFLKIDVPATATPETPWRTATISRQRYYELVYSEINPASEGQEIDYKINLIRERVEPGSDVHVLAIEKLVTVVPMTIDMTAPIALPEVTKFFDGDR